MSATAAERSETMWNDAISQVTGMIWTEFLALPLEPVAAAAESVVGANALAGYIEIRGAWTGVVELQCSPALARRAAAVMFQLPPHEAGSGHIRDALGELANMAGGNIKALMPEPCEISLPAVMTAGEGEVRRAGRVVRGMCDFDCDAERLRVAVWEDA